MTNRMHSIDFSITNGDDEKEYYLTIALDSSLMVPEMRQDAIDSAFRLMRRRIAVDLKVEAGQ